MVRKVYWLEAYPRAHQWPRCNARCAATQPYPTKTTSVAHLLGPNVLMHSRHLAVACSCNQPSSPHCTCPQSATQAVLCMCAVLDQRLQLQGQSQWHTLDCVQHWWHALTRSNTLICALACCFCSQASWQPLALNCLAKGLCSPSFPGPECLC